jgi:hypothetical protein
MQNKHPPIMATFRPKLSVIHPLNGRATNALIENAGIIHPTYSAPPRTRNSEANSGNMRLNDKKKLIAPVHIIQKDVGKV